MDKFVESEMPLASGTEELEKAVAKEIEENQQDKNLDEFLGNG